MQGEHRGNPIRRMGAKSLSRKRPKGMGMAAAIAAAIFGMTLLPIASPQEAPPVTIGYPDTYSKVIEPGSTATYNWTFVNNDWNQTFRVGVFISAGNNDWTYILNRDFFNLAPNGTWMATLTVVPPLTARSGQSIAQVTFRITNETADWNIAAPSATTTIHESPLVLGLFENPLPPPLDGKHGVFLLDILLWAMIVLVVYFVSERVFKRIARRTKTKLDDIILGIVRKPVLVLLIFLGVVESLDVLDLPTSLFALVSRVYYVVMILILTYVAYKIFRDVVIHYGKKYAEKTDTQFDDVVVPLAEKLGAVVIIVIGVAILMAYTGVDLTLLAVGSIVVSMVIAFALQDTLSNFFSGIYLLTDRPFKLGDLIVLESGDICRVERIGMRSTKLYRLFEHTIMVVPNNKLANERIVNVVQPDMRYKIVVKVGVAYGTNVDQVSRILKDVALRNPHVLRDDDKAPVVRFTAFGDSSLEFALAVWIDDVYNQWAVASELREAILKEFTAARIEIPFPQRVVWTRSLEASTEDNKSQQG